MPPEIPQFLGTLDDVRSEEGKQKDIFLSELVAAAAPVGWFEKNESQWRKFPDQNQGLSSSCVAQTIKKQALIMLWLKEQIYVKFSATHMYQRRSNKPLPGMAGIEAFDLWKQGITLEDFVPSESISDAQMDGMKIEKYEEDIGKVFSITGHVGIPGGDFETVASVIQQTGKGVMAWFYFTSEEWGELIPKIKTPNLDMTTSYRHSVTVVDFFLVQGKKYLLIEDSAHFKGFTRHLISEEFFKARNWFIRYPMNFVFEDSTVMPPNPNKPSYAFTKPLEFIPLGPDGKVSDPAKNDAQSFDVIALQDILRYEGLFPTNVTSTGYYGATTAKSVLAFQKKYNVAPLSEIEPLAGRRVGTKTIEKLNQLY